MAKTGKINVDPELEEKFYDTVQPGHRFINANLRAKNKAVSKAKREKLAQNSYLQTCASLWAEMSEEEKQEWKDADPRDEQHGWRTFVEDQCARIKWKNNL